MSDFLEIPLANSLTIQGPLSQRAAIAAEGRRCGRTYDGKPDTMNESVLSLAAQGNVRRRLPTTTCFDYRHGGMSSRVLWASRCGESLFHRVRSS